MIDSDRDLIFSATDLSSHSECAHRTVLELGAAAGSLQRPGQNDLGRELLERRGREHEKRVLDLLVSQGKQVVSVNGDPVEQTKAAMQAGVEVIYQGALSTAQWHGRPDFLVRTAGPSDLGDFHYEVADAKLARETKARAVLQLCSYSDLLSSVQGTAPAGFWLALGTEPIRLERLRADDYMAYYRRVRSQFEAFVSQPDRAEPYPEPVPHCDVCRWWKRCDDRRRADDHLSLVAGITHRHRERFRDDELLTMAQLAELKASASVPGIRDEVLGRIREQARLQVKARTAGQAFYELLPPSEEAGGLELLPEPSPGDVFFDLEGDAFFAGVGLEYLFGLLELEVSDDPFAPIAAVAGPQYHAFWAMTPAEERRAFEAVIDQIVRRRAEFPGMHVYHFGHRENDALKRLASRHGTRIDELDAFLRAGVLVDLHRITRQAVRASVESYSLKQLETLHGFTRRVPLRDAAAAMQHFGWWLETGESPLSEIGLRETVQRYNEDDCLSTWRLREWLEARRAELSALHGKPLRRPAEKESRASEERTKLNADTAAVVERLWSSLPSDPADDDAPAAARRLLGHLLGWHQRELKPAFWEYFRTLDLPAEERVEDRAVLGELRFVETVGKVKRSVIHRYEFPPQEHGIRVGSKAVDPSTQRDAGTVAELGRSHILISRGERSTAEHPRALVPGKPIATENQQARLRAFGEWVAQHGPEGRGMFRAATDLLMRRAPRLIGPPGERLLHEGEDVTDGICRLALTLDESTLAVQGPPGSGKTTAAAQAIVALVQAGRSVGVTANSHRVIVHLLQKAKQEAARLQVDLRCIHIGEEEDLDGAPSGIALSKDYDSLEESLRSRAVDLVGGTTWAWSRQQFEGALDALVVDEAGQLSLASVLAVSGVAKNLLLFGDPAQLEQPQKGVHPPGADVSALEHVIGVDAGTMPAELGVFMPHTRRLHPDICKFTSRAFYDGRLQAAARLAAQRVVAGGSLAGSGLRFVPVEHRGNTNHSPEEVGRIQELVRELFAGAPKFADATGQERPLTRDDVLIVAPYNVQVAALRHQLPGFSVGTVDKFQGQQAPIVIYSMTTSSAEDAPRGMEFLFSLNRLNVATSRAQALVAVVASPALAQAACKTPRQMRLANALCAYLELAASASRR